MFLLFSSLFFLTALIYPKAAYAHAFGISYDLPIPLWMYQYAAAAVLALSFLVISFFTGKKRNVQKIKKIDISNFFLFKFLGNAKLNVFLRILSLLLLLLTIFSGFIGTNEADKNFNMTFFWIWFLLGFTYLNIVFGNLWESINPIKTLANWIIQSFKKTDKPLFVYPQKLGSWPALFFFMTLIWIELIGGTTPKSLSIIVLSYTLINIVGSWVFNSKTWFANAELFEVYFRLVSKASLLAKDQKKVFISLPFSEILKEKAENISILALILFMLSSTAFDGFMSTTSWYFLQRNFAAPLGLSPGLFATIGLFVTFLMFFLIFIFFMSLSKNISKTKISANGLCLRFAYTHLPLIIVYNVAHYYTLLISEGQNLFRLISDPFGLGWNLFNTASYKVNMSFIDAAITWHFQVAIIILGHVIGVYLSHKLAYDIYTNNKRALLSQIPMLFLMLIYTMFGLWILSQPLAV